MFFEKNTLKFSSNNKYFFKQVKIITAYVLPVEKAIKTIDFFNSGYSPFFNSKQKKIIKITKCT